MSQAQPQNRMKVQPPWTNVYHRCPCVPVLKAVLLIGTIVVEKSVPQYRGVAMFAATSIISLTYRTMFHVKAQVVIFRMHVPAQCARVLRYGKEDILYSSLEMLLETLPPL